MKRNPVEATLGFLVLIFAGFFLFYGASKIDVGSVDGYPVFAEFSKVGGLEMGADVRINGIKAGSVTNISLDPDSYMARVELAIKNGIELPVDTVAAVADSGLMGDKYIRLEPGKQKQWIGKSGKFTKTKDYKSLEENVSEFIFLSTKEDKK